MDGVKVTRQEVLDEIAKCVMQDRNKEYGSPEDNFRCTANIANSVFGLETPGEFTFTPLRVAMFMLCIKLARMHTSPEKLDHWVDMGGYAVCGASCLDKK